MLFSFFVFVYLWLSRRYTFKSFLYRFLRQRVQCRGYFLTTSPLLSPAAQSWERYAFAGDFYVRIEPYVQKEKAECLLNVVVNNISESLKKVFVVRPFRDHYIPV